MFYFWHTSLVVLFIAVAYWLGYQYVFKKKVKTIAQKKLLKVLKNPTSQSEWLIGYRKWKAKK
jgi:positive regulator of sigma E activity